MAARAADTIVHLFVGEMTLDQYLATRVVELVVHGLDLAAAIDLPTPAPGAAARVVARLPFALRYAAVAAVGDRIVIAGGSLASGAARAGER